MIRFDLEKYGLYGFNGLTNRTYNAGITAAYVHDIQLYLERNLKRAKKQFYNSNQFEHINLEYYVAVYWIISHTF